MRATGASALFNAGVPERLIRDVTGHKSNALHLYARPTEQQKKQVSAVLVQGEEFGKECACSYKCNPAKKFVMVPLCAIHFSLVLVTATLTIKPQNFTVNISPSATTQSPEYDVKHILGGIELEDLFSE